MQRIRYSRPILVLGSIFLFAVGSAWAQHGSHGHGPHSLHDLLRGLHGHGQGERVEPGTFMHHLVEQLELSDVQRDDLGVVFSEHVDGNRLQRDSLKAARQLLEELVHAPQLDEIAIRNAAAEVAAIEADLAVSRATFLQQLRQVLTPEQLTEFEELQQQRRARAEKRHEGHR